MERQASNWLPIIGIGHFFAKGLVSTVTGLVVWICSMAGLLPALFTGAGGLRRVVGNFGLG
jgi:hypothetical protein